MRVSKALENQVIAYALTLTPTPCFDRWYTELVEVLSTPLPKGEGLFTNGFSAQASTQCPDYPGQVWLGSLGLAL